METPNVPAALRLAGPQGLDIDPRTASYFLGRRAIRTSGPIGACRSGSSGCSSCSPTSRPAPPAFTAFRPTGWSSSACSFPSERKSAITRHGRYFAVFPSPAGSGAAICTPIPTCPMAPCRSAHRRGLSGGGLRFRADVGAFHRPIPLADRRHPPLALELVSPPSSVPSCMPWRPARANCGTSWPPGCPLDFEPAGDRRDRAGARRPRRRGRRLRRHRPSRLVAADDRRRPRHRGRPRGRSLQSRLLRRSRPRRWMVSARPAAAARASGSPPSPPMMRISRPTMPSAAGCM